MKVWVLTSMVNAYDQYGEYFEACFKEKPTPEQLAVITGLTKEHWESNPCGGRLEWEDEWYNLHEIEYGQKFEGE